MPKSIDDQVLELLELLKTKQEEIKKAEVKPQWKTSCTISLDSSLQNRVNIMTVTDPAELINIYGFLLNRDSTWKSAAEALGFEEDSSYQGYPIAEWKSDLRSRANQLALKGRKEALKKLDKKINSLVSADQRRELELKAIQEELGV